MINEILKNIGLNQREIDVFLQVSAQGSIKAAVVAKELDLPKTTVIETLYALEARGLVSKTMEKNSFIFHAEDPEILMVNLDRKVEQLTSNKEKLKSIIPMLRAKKQKKNVPSVKYFEGKEGIIQLYEDTLKASTDILAYGSSEDELKYLSGYFPEYWNKRKKARIKLTGLMPDSDFNKEHSSTTDINHLRTTFLYPQKYRAPLEIDVYDNKVVLMSFQEMFGVMIESEVIAEAMRNILKLAHESRLIKR